LPAGSAGWPRPVAGSGSRSSSIFRGTQTLASSPASASSWTAPSSPEERCRALGVRPRTRQLQLVTTRLGIGTLGLIHAGYAPHGATDLAGGELVRGTRQANRHAVVRWMDGGPRPSACLRQQNQVARRTGGATQVDA